MSKKFKELEISLVTRVFERFSHWTEKWFGLDCFFLAKVLVLISVMLTGFSLLGFVSLKEHFGSIGMFMMLVSYSSTLQEIDLARNEGSKQSESAMRNHRLVSKAQLRCILLTMTFLLVLFSYHMLFTPNKHTPQIRNVLATCLCAVFLLAYCFEAFIACTPLRPGKSKMRRLWEKFKSKLIMDDDGSMEPTPA